jgi:beta-glucosidase
VYQNAQVAPGQHLDLLFPVANPGTIQITSSALIIMQSRRAPDPSDHGTEPGPAARPVAQRLELFKPGTASPVAHADDPAGTLPSLSLPFNAGAADAAAAGNWTARVTNLGQVNADVLVRAAYPGTTPLPDRFPDGFLWGAATAAYQVEGNISNNDWDLFASDPRCAYRVQVNGALAKPPQTLSLKPAGPAIQHGAVDKQRQLAALKKDLDRCQLLGMKAYRFSVEWSRVQPLPGKHGMPASNDEGALEYYVQVAKEVRARNMVPLVTLSHFSLPQWVLTPPVETVTIMDSVATALAGPGYEFVCGWQLADTVTNFVHYVQAVVGRLSDLVRHWIVLNEPNGQIALGYMAGIWPPGFFADSRSAKAAYFNMLKAHVRAYDAIKAIDPGAQVGVAHHVDFCKVFDTPGGARQYDYFMHYHFLNTVINAKGAPIDVGLDPSKGDFATTKDFFGIPADQWRPKLDFIGVNYYRAAPVSSGGFLASALMAAFAEFMGGVLDIHEPGQPGLLTDLSWEIFPRGLYHFLTAFSSLYNLPLLITENGTSEVADTKRASYIVAHLSSTLRAMREDASPPVNILGYIHWSIADNFEWQYNYDPHARFGLFTVDREHSDSDGHFLRHLTEGAVAMQYLIAQGDLKGAADNFGIITDDGLSFLPPTKSPGGLWVGTAGTDFNTLGFRLYFNVLASGGLIGMIFYVGPNVWLRLEGVSFDAAKNQLSFFHANAAQAGIRGAHFVATASGKVLNGTVTLGQPSGVKVLQPALRWQATKNPLFGVWRHQDFYLSFWNAEGAFANTIARVKPRPETAWVRPASVTTSPDDQNVTVEVLMPPQVISAQVQGDRLVGSSTAIIETVPFEAQRLADQLPFG